MLHKLHTLSTERLVAVLLLITDHHNGDVDLITVAVRIRAELASRGVKL